MNYGDRGKVTSRIDRLGLETRYDYDAASRLTLVTAPNETTFEWLYDAEHQLSGTVDSAGHITTFNYDAVGRHTQTTYADSSTASWAFDVADRITVATDENGNTRTIGFDGASRQTSRVFANGDSYSWAYDTGHSLTSLTDANGTTTYAYDILGQPTQVTFAGGTGGFSFGYDTGQLLTRLTDGTGADTTFVYGTAGRLTQLTFEGSSTRIEYAHDAWGAVTSANTVENGVTTTSVTRAYDDRGRLTGETQQVGALPAQTVTYAYGAADTLTQLTAGGRAISFEYDSSNGTLTGITLVGIGTTTYAYDGAGRVSRKTFGSGAKAEFGFDSRQRVTSVAHMTSGGGTISTHTYERDGVGNITSWTRVGVGAGTFTYGYDGRNQLTSVNDGTATSTYTYDGAQNRLTTTVSGGGPTETATVNAGNQVTQTVHSVNGTTTYAYDGDGNLTGRVRGAQSDTYSYDTLGLLTSATVATVTTNITTDAFGRRVTYTTGGSSTHYVYDAVGNPIVELDDTGAVQAVYVMEPGIDRPLAQFRGGAVYYYHTDHLGSTWAITNSAEATVRTYVYGPYGTITAETGTLENIYHFTGRQFDTSLELYYYRSRYYSAQLARFISRDVILPPNVPVSYPYAENSPLMSRDPMGTHPLPVGTIVPSQIVGDFAVDLPVDLLPALPLVCFIRKTAQSEGKSLRFIDVGLAEFTLGARHDYANYATFTANGLTVRFFDPAHDHMFFLGPISGPELRRLNAYRHPGITFPHEGYHVFQRRTVPVFVDQLLEFLVRRLIDRPLMDAEDSARDRNVCSFCGSEDGKSRTLSVFRHNACLCGMDF